MRRNTEEVIEAGLQLDLGERAAVAQRLLASLHSDDHAEQDEVDAAWQEEIGTRVDEILTGKVELISFAESRKIVQERLAAIRK